MNRESESEDEGPLVALDYVGLYPRIMSSLARYGVPAHADHGAVPAPAPEPQLEGLDRWRWRDRIMIPDPIPAPVPAPAPRPEELDGPWVWRDDPDSPLPALEEVSPRQHIPRGNSDFDGDSQIQRVWPPDDSISNDHEPPRQEDHSDERQRERLMLDMFLRRQQDFNDERRREQRIGREFRMEGHFGESRFGVGSRDAVEGAPGFGRRFNVMDDCLGAVRMFGIRGSGKNWVARELAQMERERQRVRLTVESERFDPCKLESYFHTEERKGRLEVDPDSTRGLGTQEIEEYTCSICLGLRVDPYTLPCGHSFCGGCVDNLIDDIYAVRCPLCRRDFNPTDPTVQSDLKVCVDAVRFDCKECGRIHTVADRCKMYVCRFCLGTPRQTDLALHLETECVADTDVASADTDTARGVLDKCPRCRETIFRVHHEVHRNECARRPELDPFPKCDKCRGRFKRELLEAHVLKCEGGTVLKKQKSEQTVADPRLMSRRDRLKAKLKVRSKSGDGRRTGRQN